ncbi:RICIN domain-containing protein [Streptomyces sp. NBC_01334]|uniref:RICIN domain-containing protein n=1 Tax=Streptomyces sp. NBC_01334 TaxID=2903827 RepID=UPI002E1462D3|nr:RICIN domain-containing protein [Streptomyces sp. NBC_01334]
MHTTRSAFAAVVAGTLMAVASPAIAHAQSPQTDDWGQAATAPSGQSLAATTYGIRNYKSGKFLQPTGTGNGATVVQQTANQSTSYQHWGAVPDGDYYSFDSLVAGNLGIDGASTANGAAAIVATPSGDANQDWLLAYNANYPDGTFQLYNKKSGKCLGIDGASTANGAQALQFTCDGSANQGWTLRLPS